MEEQLPHALTLPPLSRDRARNPVESYYTNVAHYKQVAAKRCFCFAASMPWNRKSWIVYMKSASSRALISRSSFSHGAPLGDTFVICRVDIYARARRFYTRVLHGTMLPLRLILQLLMLTRGKQWSLLIGRFAHACIHVLYTLYTPG